MIEPRTAEDATVDLLIGEIAEEFTQRALSGEKPDPEEYIRRHPSQADVLRQLLPLLQSIRPNAENAVEGRGQRRGSEVDDHHSPTANELLGDYRIVREIGRGGMGVVYEAEQLSLRRRVALKVLPLAAMLDERRLQRFKNEALAAAQLDHPHIVDVVGVGCERGVHYYAMRYIEGQTLAEVIDALRDGNGFVGRISNPSGRIGNPSYDTVPIAGLPTQGLEVPRDFGNPWELTEKQSRYRAAAEICRQVADALDHAHQSGIVHRDVKPSNLMLDANGKAWVCDFGLAHMEDAANPLTRTGDMVGTLRFMCPEQLTAVRDSCAAAHPSRAAAIPVMDHRIDVYALGATLYELLTLRPAFDGATREELLRRIIAEEPKRPRKHDPGIPVELETIVLKAMAKLPGDRYATARDFADDLRRFLDDKPILAKRPTMRQRLSRWSRHHRAIVRSAAAAGAVCIAVLLVGAILIELARREAVAEKTRADAQADLADRRRREAERLQALEEQNFRRALHAVNVMLTRVAQQELANVPGMHDVRRELLEEALALYREFLNQRRGDPRVRLETLKAYDRVGEITLLLGRRDESERAYRRLLELAAEFRRDGGSADEYRIQSAVAWHNLGMIHFARGENRQAENAYRESLRNGKLSARRRKDVIIRKMRGGSYNNLGNVVSRRGDRKQAAALFRKAVAEYEALAAEFPKASSHRQTLATVHCSLSGHLAASGQPAAAEKHCRRALELLSALVKQRPAVTTYRRELARTHGMLGGLLRSDGRLDASKRHFQLALDMQQKLFDGQAVSAVRYRIPDFVQEVARTHSNYSLLLRKTGPPELALRHSRKSIELRRKLVADFPDQPVYQMEAARGRRHLAELLIRSGDQPQAIRELEQSREELTALVARQRNVPLFRAELAETLFELGRIHVRREEFDSAEPHLRRSVELIEPIAAKPSAAVRQRGLLGEARIWHGMLLYRQKEYDRAAAEFLQAADVYAKLAAEYPTVERYAHNLATARQNRTLSLLRTTRLANAEASLRETLSAYANVMTSPAAADRYRSRFRGASSTLGRMLRTRAPGSNDETDLLLMSVNAWMSGEKRRSRLWFDRAVAARSRNATTTPFFHRLLVEAGRLAGFALPPVEARRPGPRPIAPP